jgi:uncharacterized protein
MHQDLAVRKSTIAGRGVYALRDFKRGETLRRFGGKVTSVPSLKRIYKKGGAKVSCDAFQIGVRKYLILDEFSVCINHSCSPNTAFKGERELVAIKPIKKGDEIFYDYSATEWTPRDYTEYNHSMWPMNCKCGSAHCRKLITCFAYLPKAVQRKYLAGTIQDHIREKLKLPADKQRCDVCEKRISEFKKHSLHR